MTVYCMCPVKWWIRLLETKSGFFWFFLHEQILFPKHEWSHCRRSRDARYYEILDDRDTGIPLYFVTSSIVDNFCKKIQPCEPSAVLYVGWLKLVRIKWSVWICVFSERSLYAVARPSVVYLSSVCLSVTLVQPTQAVVIFRNISTALGTLAIRWHPLKISRRSSWGTPPPRELNTRGVAKYSDFGSIDG